MRTIVHGIDIVEIARITQMLADHGSRFVERCFTEAEQSYAEASPKRRDERYAARFAAKEAVLKALGTGWRNGISWRDIAICSEPSGQPALSLTGRSAQIAGELQIACWQVSLSHSKTMAIASVIGCREE